MRCPARYTTPVESSSSASSRSRTLADYTSSKPPRGARRRMRTTDVVRHATKVDATRERSLRLQSSNFLLRIQKTAATTVSSPCLPARMSGERSARAISFESPLPRNALMDLESGPNCWRSQNSTVLKRWGLHFFTRFMPSGHHCCCIGKDLAAADGWNGGTGALDFALCLRRKCGSRSRHTCCLDSVPHTDGQLPISSFLAGAWKLQGRTSHPNCKASPLMDRRALEQ